MHSTKCPINVFYKRFYGVSGKTNQWIQAFLQDRTQCVVVNGSHSDPSPVISGVPQGTVLGPMLFLLYINDIVKDLKSEIRLFADDSILYREINSPEDHTILQQDLEKLEKWSNTWQMAFNVSKCEVMSITLKKSPSLYNYIMNNSVLERTSSSKYLGVTITSNLSWNTQTDLAAKKASKTLGMLRRNISSASRATKKRAYEALVRPTMEYATTAWASHTARNINKLEAVQRAAARFVCHNYSRESSVTSMIRNIGWDSLAVRRQAKDMCMFFKIQYELVKIQFPPTIVLSPYTRTRQAHCLKYQVPMATINPYKHSFFIRCIPVWNSLPAAVVKADSVAAFQQQVLPAVRALH